jgi:hypothetical protein
MEKPKSLSEKFEDKKAKRLDKRREQLRRMGTPEEQIDTKIALQDYEAMPLHQRIRRLESLVSGSLTGLSNDIAALQHNEVQISTILDQNFRAFSKALEKVGLSMEQQKEIMEETKREIDAEAQEAAQREEAARKAQEEAAEKARLESDVDKPGEPAPPPDGATVFGG